MAKRDPVVLFCGLGYLRYQYLRIPHSDCHNLTSSILMTALRIAWRVAASIANGWLEANAHARIERPDSPLMKASRGHLDLRRRQHRHRRLRFGGNLT